MIFLALDFFTIYIAMTTLHSHSWLCITRNGKPSPVHLKRQEARGVTAFMKGWSVPQ